MVLQQYQNIDQTIEQAQVIQQDLLREEQYGSNSYNIGALDGSFSGMLKIAPKAIGTAIYRPFIYERNATMLVSGLENLILIFSGLFLIFTINPIRFFKTISNNPLLLHCLTSRFICFWSWNCKYKLWSTGQISNSINTFFYTMLYIIKFKAKPT